MKVRLALTGLILIFLILPVTAFAATGSNLGQYGTNFSPAVLTGQVTDSAGNPVSGATVSTIAGHSTTTDANGNYTLALDAPGIYVVTSASGTTTTTNTVDVTLGTTLALSPIFPRVIIPGIPTLPQWGMILMTLALLTLATWHLAGQPVFSGSSSSGPALRLPARPRWPSSLLLGQVVAATGLLMYALAGEPIRSHDGLGVVLAGVLIGAMIEAYRRNREWV